MRDVWHRDKVDPAPLLEEARRAARWSRDYSGPLGFELFSDEEQISLRFKLEHRGHNSNFDVMWAGAAPRIEAYLEWLTGRGFGRAWQ
jgi:hypothetical protein